MANLEGHTYHAFISHSSKDIDYVEELTEKLENDGFVCFMYERDMLAKIVDGIVSNIQQSRRVILIITPSFLESKWAIFETTEALHKCHREKVVAVIPVLHGVPPEKCPHYLKPYRYHDTKEANFYENLKQAITEDRATATLIPAGDVAHGLVWSYYYGFLKLVLPGLPERCVKWSETQEPIPMLNQMIIVIPTSCYCPASWSTIDGEHFQHVGFIDYRATRAGNIHRDYKSSVHVVKDPKTGERFRFIGEFATPLLSMYEMEQSQLAGLNKDEMNHQRILFTEKLRDILWHPSNNECHHKASILEYDNDTTEKAQQLATILCAHIRSELRREKEMEEINKEMNSMSTSTAKMIHD